MPELLPNSEQEPRADILAVVEAYFPDDEEFFAGLDEEDCLGAVYGQLLESGEDPDEVFEVYGITSEEGPHEA